MEQKLIVQTSADYIRSCQKLSQQNNQSLPKLWNINYVISWEVTATPVAASPQRSVYFSLPGIHTS